MNVAFGTPKYVTEIQPETNTVVLGDVEDLLRNGLIAGKINSMKYPEIPTGIETVTQIRYNDPGTLARLTNLGKEVQVEFMANVKGVAPGQSVVFYEGDDVIGGGIIMKSLK